MTQQSVFISELRQQTTVKMDKGIRKRMTSRDRANATIDDRSRRLNDRLKRNGTNIGNTMDTMTSEKMTKKARPTANQVIRKEKTGSRFECGDDENTLSLADDESVDDALKQRKQLGKDTCDVHRDNDIEHMTITLEKKNEVSLLSAPAPSRSTLVSLENSVFNELSHGVKLSWKKQRKGMDRIFGPCVRDEFMKDYKFCNEKICRHIVTKCMARNEIVLTLGMSYDQFVDVTSKSPIVSTFFNSQRHQIQSKMRSVYIGEKFLVTRQSVALNDSLTIVHPLPFTRPIARTQGKGRHRPR